ncbi:hypothetical protein AB1Y20_003026 [Prymnesium parvum]|uniref:Sfi1 spindle body domain-containing protein n=1 Tax=Prymnesium parvum TaxID=97485 RepID=A0AB34JB04_PRYPA
MSFALVKQWRGHAALVRAKRTKATMCVFDRRLRSLRNGIHNWKFNHNAKEAAMQSLRRAYAGFSEKARFACMMSWKQHAAERFDAEAQVDKGISRWINRTASKCFKQWQAVWRVQLKKMSKVRIAISWLSKSVLMRTLAGFKEILNERREKMLCVDVMLKQTMRRGLLGMFLGWVKIWRKYKLNEKLDGMGSNHMRSMAMRSLGGILQYWAYTARLFSLMATGRERNVRVEMRSTIRCFRRHAANARFVRAAIHNADARMRAVLSDWHQTAYAMIIVSDMFLTNTLRDVARRLRFWQRLTSSSNARELRGKYLTSRRRWYEQQQLLQLWHLFTIAKRHHRQHASRDAMRRIGQAATNRRWQRHGTLRALGHLCKGIIYKVLTGWRLHVTTARTMRLEMLQAHASQLALDQHLRRIRARVMCKVFVSWSGRCMNKARHRRKWQAAALMIGYRRGFVQWHEATTDRSHRFMLDDAAMSHEYSSTISSAFNRWAGRAVREARHVGIFRVLVERHESGVQLRVLLAWRELLIQARRAVALRARVFDRILELVFNAWQAYTSDGVQLIDRAKSHLSRSQLTIKSEVWAAWAVKTNSIARRVRVQYVILSRREASLKRNGLIHWYGVYLRAERHMRRAANHFGFRTLGTIWSAWHAYFRSCKVRQAQIASQVDVFHRNRESWACATILVEWKAVVALHKKQKKSAREALVMLKTYTSAVHALHSRLGNATSYHLQRLSGIVFFHWRALSWSRNWEKRAEMDNEDPDVSQWQGSIASALVSGSVAFVQSAKRDFLAGKATPPASPGKKSKHAQSAEEDVAIASHGSPTKHVNDNSEALDQGVTFNDVASLLVWPGPTLQQVQRLNVAQETAAHPCSFWMGNRSDAVCR